jgi:hypothetical protein
MYQEIQMRHSLTGAEMELQEVDTVTVFMGKTVNYQRVQYYHPTTGTIATTPEQEEENHRRMEAAAANLPLDDNASFTPPADMPADQPETPREV